MTGKWFEVEITGEITMWTGKPRHTTTAFRGYNVGGKALARRAGDRVEVWDQRGAGTLVVDLDVARSNLRYISRRPFKHQEWANETCMRMGQPLDLDTWRKQR